MKLFTVVFGVAFLASSISFANPCDDDVQKLCSDCQPGMGTIGACLQAHMQARGDGQLSYQCREWLKKAEPVLRKLSSACGSAAREYCRDVRPGAQRIKNCLMSNFDKLPSECQQALKGAEQ